MTTKEKQSSVRVIRDFMDSVVIMLAKSDVERERFLDMFPDATGLGTDGTLWTDDEHRRHYLAIMATARELLEYVPSGE